MSITPETSTRPLPPGVTEFDLEKALAAFAAAIGEDKVASDAESLEDFQDPFQVPGSATNLPSAVVSPTSTEDVQSVVRMIEAIHTSQSRPGLSVRLAPWLRGGPAQRRSNIRMTNSDDALAVHGRAGTGQHDAWKIRGLQ